LFDADGLLRDLISFRENVGFRLMDDTPMPDDLSEPLWEAFQIVHKVIESMKEKYGDINSHGSIFTSDNRKNQMTSIQTC
jgi:hypothetical protein